MAHAVGIVAMIIIFYPVKLKAIIRVDAFQIEEATQWKSVITCISIFE